ncbi:MAG: hypothetical protein KBS69_07735, partial [Bacteroidales bacterium]|nr:hypothetical protein [Candidatus Colicola caccequi]
MEDESYVSLTYRALSAIQHLQDGTYPIADLEEESSYLTGYDFYGWPAGSYYEDVNGNVYYFVSGTVTVESLDGATTITINATSAHGSSITVTYSGETPQPSGDHTIVIADYADVNFNTFDGAYTVTSDQSEGASKPVYNADSQDLRLYAKNTFTLTSNNAEMTEIVFNISDKGLARQADIAVSAGEITSYDMDNAKVIWVGNATEVIFTVGDKATHGSDGATKAGQFDFTSIDIVNPATGLFDVNVNANVNKFMYNGNVMINVNGVIYNVLGAKVAR